MSDIFDEIVNCPKFPPRLCKNRNCKKEFYPRRRDQIYCSSWCNDNRTRLNHNLRKTGLSSEEAYSLRRMQKTCDICGTDTPRGTYNQWHIDHCAVTYKIRGLLCNNCNLGIGFMGHSVDRLKSAVEYLKRSEKDS